MKKMMLISTMAAILIVGQSAYAQRNNDADNGRADSNPNQTNHSSQTVNTTGGRGQNTLPIGRIVNDVPRNSVSLRRNQQAYRYYNGNFYRPRNEGGFVVVRPPVGARIASLPSGFISFSIGLNRYFYYNHAYYRRDPATREYIVIEQPSGAEEAVVSASNTDSGEVYVYPNAGQSEEQRERDRYECYLWAVEETGFEPAAENPDYELSGNYRRALSACLEGRDYTVK